MDDLNVILSILKTLNGFIHENIAITIIIVVILIVYRRSFITYAPQLIMILAGKKTFKDLIMQRPERNYGFVQKYVWIAPENVVAQDCEAFQAWINSIIDHARRMGMAMTFNLVAVKVINKPALDGFKHTIESAIHRDNIVLTIVFPIPGESEIMTDFMHWMQSKIDETDTKSIRVKRDQFGINPRRD